MRTRLLFFATDTTPEAAGYRHKDALQAEVNGKNDTKTSKRISLQPMRSY